MNTAARDHGDAGCEGDPVKAYRQTEDMAGIAIYLASRAGDYVVGNAIAVDGGIVYANLSLLSPVTAKPLSSSASSADRSRNTVRAYGDVELGHEVLRRRSDARSNFGIGRKSCNLVGKILRRAGLELDAV